MGIYRGVLIDRGIRVYRAGAAINHQYLVNRPATILNQSAIPSPAIRNFPTQSFGIRNVALIIALPLAA